MKLYSLTQYEQIVSSSRVIEKDAYGEKVLRTKDGHFVKIFRTKRKFSTSAIVPYAHRFCANAAKLKQRHIRTVDILELSFCRAVKRHLVRYAPIEGITLREALKDPAYLESLLMNFAGFLGVLHSKGVYFRSIHFGNVIVQPHSSELALIDIGDMEFRRSSLGPRLRVRNFKHFFRYQEDVACLNLFGPQRFVDVYLEKSGMPARQQEVFLRKLAKLGSLHGLKLNGEVIESKEISAD